MKTATTKKTTTATATAKTTPAAAATPAPAATKKVTATTTSSKAKTSASKSAGAAVVAPTKNKGVVAKVAKATKGTKRAAREPESTIQRPSRNRTAYMMFVKDHRKNTQTQHPDMDFVTVTRDIAERWKALTDAQRKPYQDRAAKDKERYDAEVAKFKVSHPGETLTIKKKKRVLKLKGPKKARSAYVFFTKEQRQSVQEANPDADFGSITKQIATSWNALTAAQKSKYEKLASEDRTRFEGENKSFNEAHPEVKRRKIKAKKSAPKKPRSAYLFYTMEKRSAFKAANPDKDFGTLTKMVAEDWGKLPAAQKKKYEKLAEDDKKRHETEFSSYVPPTDEELDADEPSRKKKREGPKRPKSSYLFFSMAERQKVQSEDASLKFGDVTKKIANAWKELSARERGKYEEQAKADHDRYVREVEATKA